MSFSIATNVKAGQRIGQYERQASLIILLQPVLQSLAADLGVGTRQQFLPVHRSNEIVVGAEVDEAFGDPDQVNILSNQQDRKLAEGLIGSALRDEAQWVAAGKRQADNDWLRVTVQQGLSVDACSSADYRM